MDADILRINLCLDKYLFRCQTTIRSYTFQNAVGELWRSRYQADQNPVVINNGHRDFVFASRNKALKLRVHVLASHCQ